MLYLHGLGHFYPPAVITNRFLEDLDIGTTEDWIMERVGIERRHTVLDLDYIKSTRNADPRAAFEACLYSNAETGAEAARMAIERAGIKPEDIGLVVSGSSAPDNVSPAEAATIAAQLGIDVPCFDLNSACTSFGMQISVLSSMMPEALPPFILITNPENLTKCLDYSDRSAAPLFGDGTTAAVLSAEVPSKLRFSVVPLRIQADLLGQGHHPEDGAFQPGRPCGPGFCHQEGDGMRPQAAIDLQRELEQVQVRRPPGEHGHAQHRLRTVQHPGLQSLVQREPSREHGKRGCAGRRERALARPVPGHPHSRGPCRGRAHVGFNDAENG